VANSAPVLEIRRCPVRLQVQSAVTSRVPSLAVTWDLTVTSFQASIVTWVMKVEAVPSKVMRFMLMKATATGVSVWLMPFTKTWSVWKLPIVSLFFVVMKSSSASVIHIPPREEVPPRLSVEALWFDTWRVTFA